MPTWKNPTPTVDCIVELPGDRIVLIRRKNEPIGWALPGGFVDEEERACGRCEKRRGSRST
jgi:8-oxo-dGTP diphosphatase